MKKLFLLAALTACTPAPTINITLLSIADEINPEVDLEFSFEAGDRQAFLRIEGEPIPVIESITLPEGFDTLPLRVTAQAFIGERQVAFGFADLSPGEQDATIRFSVCSNGATEAEELCDDANVIDDDGCDSTCRPTGCNSGVLTPGEVCFTAQNSLVATASPSDLFIKDTNGDQLLDLIASYSTEGNTRIFFGSEDNQFGNFIEVNIGAQIRNIIVGDLNSDTKQDILATGISFFLPFLNQTTKANDPIFENSQFGVGSSDIRDLAFIDLDIDLFPDLILLDFQANAAHIYSNAGDGTFDPSFSSVATGAQPIAFTIADIDQDDDQDLITANLSGSLSILTNSGGTLTESRATTNGAPSALTSADFDGDGTVDIAVVTATNFLSIFAKINGSFQAVADFPTPLNPSGIAAADLDQDGDIDLAISSQSANTVTLFLNNGQGQFAPAGPPIASTTTPKAITAADINRDGLLDFVTTGQDLGLIFSTP